MVSISVVTDDISKDLRKNAEDIAKLAGSSETTRVSSNKMLGGSMPYRMMLELVIGMVMGIGIGIGLDYIFNLFPVFLIIFSLLGFGAGVRVMLQTARQLNANDSE